MDKNVKENWKIEQKFEKIDKKVANLTENGEVCKPRFF